MPLAPVAIPRRFEGRSVLVTGAGTGFGAEIAAVLARDAFWWLDAPVERYCVADVPMPYHPALLEAVLPSAEGVVARAEALLAA